MLIEVTPTSSEAVAVIVTESVVIGLTGLEETETVGAVVSGGGETMKLLVPEDGSLPVFPMASEAVE